LGGIDDAFGLRQRKRVGHGITGIGHDRKVDSIVAQLFDDLDLLGAIGSDVDRVRLGRAHLRRNSRKLLRGGRHRHLLDELAPGLRQFGLEFVDDRLAKRIVDIDKHDILELLLFDQVWDHRPHFEIGEGNDVPEIVPEFGQVGPDPAAVDGDDLISGRQCRDRLGDAGKGRKDVWHLIDVDELRHADHRRLRHTLAILVANGEVTRQHLVSVDVLDRKVGARHEDVAIGRIGAAERKQRADRKILGAGECRREECGCGRNGQQDALVHDFGSPPNWLDRCSRTGSSVLRRVPVLRPGVPPCYPVKWPLPCALFRNRVGHSRIRLRF